MTNQHNIGLATDLGCLFEYSMMEMCYLIQDTDGVIWTISEYDYANCRWDQYKPHAPNGTTPIHLDDGTPVGYTTQTIGSKNYATQRFLERPKSTPLALASSVSPMVQMRTVTLTIKQSNTSALVLIANSRAELEGLQDVVLFHDPPALKTNAYPGCQIWFYLNDQTFHAESEWGNTLVSEQTIHYWLAAGRTNGQHRNTPAALYGNPAQSPRPGAGTQSSSASCNISSAQAYYAAQQAAYQSSLNKALLAQLSPQQATSILNQYNQAIAYLYNGEPTKPLPRDPLPVVGEIVAWRGWAIQGTGLYSISRTTVKWEPGAVLQSAIPDDAARSDIGIHAFKDRDHAKRYLSRDYRSVLVAIGRVALWGEVVEAEYGYRAEFARVLSVEEIINKQARYNSGILAKISVMVSNWMNLLEQLQSRYNTLKENTDDERA